MSGNNSEPQITGGGVEPCDVSRVKIKAADKIFPLKSTEQLAKEYEAEVVANGTMDLNAEAMPAVVKSHLPLHLQPRPKKPVNKRSQVEANSDSSAVTTTPAMEKRRQVERWFNSPTDAFLSPCTQKLMKPKESANNHIEPLNLNQNDDNMDIN